MKVCLILFISILFGACRSDNMHEKKVEMFKTVQQIDVLNNIYVIDEVNILMESQKSELNHTLETNYNNSGIEILIIITSSFKLYGNEENYTDYFLYTYDKNVDKNVVLVVLFSEDKKVFIRTNKNSLKKYSKERCKHVIEHYMLPYLREGDFFKGLQKGINELIYIKNV